MRRSRWTPGPWCATAGLLCLLGASSSGVLPRAAAEPPRGRNLLLLVGCNEYRVLRDAWIARAKGDPGAVTRALRDYEYKRLRGPVNDIARFEQAFRLCHEPPALVIRLATQDIAADPTAGTFGTPEGSHPPTLANIRAAMAQLVAECQPGDRVTTLFSGHGAQVPDQKGEGRDEADELDEAFLPEDVSRWDGTDIPGVLRDDEISTFAHSLHARGASLWAIFESCHSGTMSRGDGSGATARSLTPDDLGVPATSAARPWAGGAAEDALPPGCTFLYAAHSGERGWERLARDRRPSGIVEQALGPAAKPEEKLGDLTFAVCYALRTAGAGMTFRELHDRITALYERQGLSTTCTPGLEGDSALRVSSRTKDAVPAMLLARTATGLRLSEGRLWGLVPGTLLRVLSADRQTTLGYAEITKAELLSAECRALAEWPATARGEAPKVPLLPDSFTEGACEVEQVPLTRSLLRLCLVDDRGQAVPLPGALPDQLVNGSKTRLLWAAEPQDAAWHVLSKPDGTFLVRPASHATGSSAYPADRGNLEQTLVSLAKVHALLLETREDVGRPNPLDKLRVELKRTAPARSGQTAQVQIVPHGSPVRPGDLVQLVLTNADSSSLYVQVFFLDGSQGITQVLPPPGAATPPLAPGKSISFPDQAGAVRDGTQGWEHMLLFATRAPLRADAAPAAEEAGRQHLDWIAQPPLPLPPTPANRGPAEKGLGRGASAQDSSQGLDELSGFARPRARSRGGEATLGRALFSWRAAWGDVGAPATYAPGSPPILDAEALLLGSAGTPEGRASERSAGPAAAPPPAAAAAGRALLGIATPTGVRSAIQIADRGGVLAPLGAVWSAGRFRDDGRFAVPLRRSGSDLPVYGLLIATDVRRGVALLRLTTPSAGSEGVALAEAAPATGASCTVLRQSADGRPVVEEEGRIQAVEVAPAGLLRLSARRHGVPEAEIGGFLTAAEAGSTARIAVAGPVGSADGVLLDAAGRCVGLVVDGDATATYALAAEELLSFLAADTQTAAPGPAWVPSPALTGGWTARDAQSGAMLRGTRTRPSAVLFDLDRSPGSPAEADLAIGFGPERRIAWYDRGGQSKDGGFDLILIDEDQDEVADAAFERAGPGAPWVAIPPQGRPWLCMACLGRPERVREYATQDMTPDDMLVEAATQAVRGLGR